MMAFVLGFLYFNQLERLHALNKAMLSVLIFSVISSVLGYTLGIGRNFDYDQDSSQQAIGLLGSSGLYSAAVAIGIIPIIGITFKRHFWRWLLYGFAVTAYIFILLNIRRTAILIPIVGLLTFAWVSPRKFKAISGFFMAIIVLIILSPFYEATLLSRFKVREEQGRFDPDFYKTESRFVENVEVFTNTFSFKDPIKSFFGYKIFASGREKGTSIRMYHSDPASLLAGTGIIGFFLYVYIYIELFRYARVIRKPSSPYFKLFKSTYYSLLFISLFISLNGSLTVVSLRSLLFLYLGAMLSLMYNSGIPYQEGQHS